MRMSSSRSVQSSGSESTIDWKVSAKPIARKPSVAMLDSVAGIGTDAIETERGAVDPARAEAEWRVLREGCGLLDRSERGKLALSGAGAVEFLNGQVTNELEGIASGEG